MKTYLLDSRTVSAFEFLLGAGIVIGHNVFKTVPNEVPILAAAYWVAMVLASVLFGYGHYYKGPVGIIDSGVAGLILGSAYLLTGRNLWTSILAHGFIDTFAVTVLYLSPPSSRA